MKKLIALMLGLVMIFSLSTTAFAAGEQSGTTTLTAEVPEASYTIHIPADATLTYGDTSVKTLGDVYVSDVVNVNGTIHVISYATALKNGSNYIPVSYYMHDETAKQTFNGESEEFAGWTVYDEYGDIIENTVLVSVDDWSGAVPGTYTSTITWNFTIEPLE